ncbi:MAG: acyl-CoA dehydratase activase-related protein [Syntrophomonadaceae bacterium]|nr:acyl-CoA dehydratase activase-related protein [Syntrophomonadaceae bacterium]
MKVGIPQGLFFFYYYPLWKTFFQDLGAEVVTSLPTNRQTIEKGVESAVDEACFPIKVYYGHVRELCGQSLDYIFIPRLVSVEPRSFICPKFMGLPDMIKAVMPDLPPVINITVDISRTERSLQQDIITVGQMFTAHKKKIQAAYQHGRQELRQCQELCRAGYNMAEAIKIWEGEEILLPSDYALNLGVLGHGYSLYDQTISMNLIARLRRMGCRVQVVETLDRNAIEVNAAQIPKRVFWTLGRKMVGSALLMEQRPEIDGIIYLACFGCGPDSMVGEIIERKVKTKPFMMMTIDEHTGEAGMVTRLEAFCDMLLRKREVSSESYISAHGRRAYSH